MKQTHLELVPGTTGQWRVILRDSAGALIDSGDITAAWFTIKSALADADSAALAQLELSAGIIIVDPSSANTGEVDIVLPADTSESWTVGSVYYWDLRVQFADGVVEVPNGMSGRISILPAVTGATNN